MTDLDAPPPTDDVDDLVRDLEVALGVLPEHAKVDDALEQRRRRALPLRRVDEAHLDGPGRGDETRTADAAAAVGEDVDALEGVARDDAGDVAVEGGERGRRQALGHRDAVEHQERGRPGESVRRACLPARRVM